MVYVYLGGRGGGGEIGGGKGGGGEMHQCSCGGDVILGGAGGRLPSSQSGRAGSETW